MMRPLRLPHYCSHSRFTRKIISVKMMFDIELLFFSSEICNINLGVSSIFLLVWCTTSLFLFMIYTNVIIFGAVEVITRGHAKGVFHISYLFPRI